MTQGNIIVKYILRAVAFIGKNLYCPSMSRYSTIGYGEIVSYAAKAASIAESDMCSAMAAIYDAFDYYLCNGHSFKLDGVGTFSLKLNAATDVASSYDAQGGASMVTRVGVNFLPDMELKTMLDNVSISVEADDQGLPESADPYMLRLGVNGKAYFSPSQTTSPDYVTLTSNDKITLKGFNLEAFGTLKIYDQASTEQTCRIVKDDSSDTSASCAVVVTAGSTFQLKKIQLGGVDYTFTGQSTDVVGDLYYDGKVFQSGGTVGLGTKEFSFVGSGFAGKTITFNNAVIGVKESRQDRIVFDLDFTAAATNTLNIGTRQFTIISGAGYPANVQSITANGVQVLNGGQSTVLKGQTYRFVVLGQNLANERYGGLISVPAGCTKQNYKYSKQRVSFEMVVGDNAQTGSLTIGSYFSVTVTVSNARAQVTSATVVNAANSQVIAEALLNNGSVTVSSGDGIFTFNGENAASITKDCVTATGCTLQNHTEPGQVKIIANAGTYSVTVYDGSDKQTTIFQFTLISQRPSDPGE